MGSEWGVLVPEAPGEDADDSVRLPSIHLLTVLEASRASFKKKRILPRVPLSSSLNQ